MNRGIPVAAFVVAMVAMFSLGAPVIARMPDTNLLVASKAPGPGNVLLPSPKGLDVAAPEVQVLLSSIEMTVSLIDAYGRCRDDEKTHERCMRIIRNTLEHARSMIGR
jgi:hypothetical protein